MSSQGYEKKDTNVKLVVKAGIWLFAVTTVITLLMIPTMNYFLNASDYYKEKEKRSEESVVPSPQLEVTPNFLRKHHDAHEKEMLTTYSWASADKKKVRVPIDVAKKNMLEKGFPTKK